MPVSPGINEMATVTLRNRTGKLADNMKKNNAILAYMERKGSYKPVSGGRTIVQELEYAENTTYLRYSGYELLNVQPSDIATAAEFDWKQAAVVVTISGLEGEVQNTGDNAIIDLLSTRIKNAEKTLQNNIALDMYSNGSASSGKQIGGLQALIPDTANTGIVGGIDKSIWSFWRTTSFSGVTDGGGAVTSTNIQSYFNQILLRISRGMDRPDVILTDNNYYALYLASLQAIQRITDGGSSTQGWGFTALKYFGVGSSCDVVFDGGIGGGCPANHAYFINSDYLKFRPSSSRNMVPLESVQSYNQDAMMKPIVFAGNMTISNGQLQGLLRA